MTIELKLEVPKVETEVPQYTPMALRDHRRYIQWNIQGNTDDENLQIGIQNIQALFLEKFPNFNADFPRLEDNKISEDKTQQAKEFIIREVGSQKLFVKIFGNSPLARNAVPYFGSHIKALQLSFSEWGLNLLKNDEETTTPQNEQKNTKSKLPIDWHGRSNIHSSKMTKEEIAKAIEEEAIRITESGIDITEQSLKANSLSRIVFAISKYYEGGIRQLQINLRTYKKNEYDQEKSTTLYHNNELVWHLPGNTEAENLELRIRNVQVLFFKKFPEFLENFPISENGTIDPIQRKAARKFILHNISNLERFKGLVNPPIGTLDYFEGSYLIALQKAFLPLGIDFFGIDINDRSSILTVGGHILWTLPGSSKEVVGDTSRPAKILQAIFLDKYPEFVKNYPLETDGRISSELCRKAAEYILLRCGDRIKFIDVFGHSSLDKEIVPAFQGSFIEALRKCFEPWGIKFKIRDFKAERVWKNKNKVEVVETAKTIFEEEFPDFVKNFLGKGELTIKQQQEAREYVWKKLTPQSNFTNVFGGAARNHNLKGTYMDFVKELLVYWGITDIDSISSEQANEYFRKLVEGI